MDIIFLNKWRVREAADRAGLKPVNQSIANIIGCTLVTLRTKWDEGFTVDTARYLADELGCELDDLSEEK